MSTQTTVSEPVAPTRLREMRNRVLRGLLAGGQRVGLDITPHHFYSNVPDLRTLGIDTSWRRPRDMHGVRGTDIDDQVDFLRRCFSAEARDALTNRQVYEQACQENGAVGYGPVEAQVLFAFVVSHRPRLIVQIGSGVSTSTILQARDSMGLPLQMTCIDPYPTPYLIQRERAGDIELLDVPAQEVRQAVFDRLGAGDLLFIDSTHTVKIGSEVNRLILEVLPRLASGVRVHFHDIYFPYDYGRDVLSSELFFWNESVLLHSFLIDNSRVAIEASCSMLHHARPNALASLIPWYIPQPMDNGLAREGQITGHFPSSIFLRVDA